MTSSSNGQDVAVNTKDQERTQAQPSVFIPLDTSWFDKEPETYLQRDDFREFQEISGIDLRQFVAKDRETIQRAQYELVSQSVIANEIQSSYFGFGFPLRLQAAPRGAGLRLLRRRHHLSPRPSLWPETLLSLRMRGKAPGRGGVRRDHPGFHRIPGVPPEIRLRPLRPSGSGGGALRRNGPLPPEPPRTSDRTAVEIGNWGSNRKIRKKFNC
jgi:hypothetical protein